LKQDYGVQVEWKPYILKPEVPPEGLARVPKEGKVDGFSPYFRVHADRLGLKLRRSLLVPYSRPALEVAEYAKQQGKFDQFHRAVFKAYWEEAKDIGLRSVLGEIARESGLDVSEVERCLDEGRYVQSVITQSEEAKWSGINSIPSYVIGGFLIEGVQPYEFFQRAIERALCEGKE
jgi:predicted DsbA family dithiol-disulfide isomerase